VSWRWDGAERAGPPAFGQTHILAQAGSETIPTLALSRFKYCIDLGVDPKLILALIPIAGPCPGPCLACVPQLAAATLYRQMCSGSLRDEWNGLLEAMSASVYAGRMSYGSSRMVSLLRPRSCNMLQEQVRGLCMEAIWGGPNVGRGAASGRYGGGRRSCI
jgi:hypothetical protein